MSVFPLLSNLTSSWCYLWTNKYHQTIKKWRCNLKKKCLILLGSLLSFWAIPRELLSLIDIRINHETYVLMSFLQCACSYATGFMKLIFRNLFRETSFSSVSEVNIWYYNIMLLYLDILMPWFMDEAPLMIVLSLTCNNSIKLTTILHFNIESSNYLSPRSDIY